MAFTWTPQQIRWYENASEYSSFHRQLAKVLIPYLKPSDTLCNYGCGLGRLSLELAPHLSHVLCIDRDARVLDSLNRQIMLRGVTNIDTIQSDAERIRADCDVGLMVFFGTPYALMSRCMDQSRRLLIRVIDADDDNHLKGRETSAAIEHRLNEEGRVYSKRVKVFEFGQPFATLEDAYDYVTVYQSQGTKRDAEEFLKKFLIETGDSVYPYYLPKEKKLAVLVVYTRGG